MPARRAKPTADGPTVVSVTPWDEDAPTAPRRMIVALAAGKGGVGKTTLTALLAQAAAQAGRSVLVVDADPQQSLSAWADMAGGLGEGIEVLTKSSPRLDRELPRLAEPYEVVLIDCPPALSARAVTEAALRACELVLIPLQPRLADLDQLRPTIELAAAAGRPAALIINQLRKGTRAARIAVAALGDLDDVPLLGTTIPLSERVGDAYGRQHARVPEPFPALWTELVELALALEDKRA